MKAPLRVYIGFDSRELDAYAVAESSLLRHASVPVSITPLNAQRLAENGLLRRPTDLRGQRYDLPSNAPASTEFAISRFLVPFLAQSGWALFVDSDVVFLRDVAEIFALADPQYAVMCVKHENGGQPGFKMDGQAQLAYRRKNWSSCYLINTEHPANRRLSLVDVQERPGRYLHAFEWLHDSEIGEIPAAWNWLVGVNAQPAEPAIAHFTLGVPTLAGVRELEEHVIWWQAYAASGYLKGGEAA